MTSAWIAPQSHSVHFYANEYCVHRAVTEFFTQDADSDDRLVMVSRPETLTAVTEQLALGRFSPPIDPAERILFIDAETVLAQVIEGETLNLSRAECLFKDALSKARPSRARSTVRLYGEIVDILCQHGHHETAIQFEGLASLLLNVEPRLSILCGYALERFKADTNAARFPAVCQKHTHVIPVNGLGTREPTIYVIDDNVSLRLAIGRVLTSSNWPMRTFDTAEAFLAELDKFSSGCLVVDVELPGMSGLDLICRLTDAGLSWPTIVMSGLQDQKTEHEALRMGARDYLRKPFSSEALLDAIARAFL